MGLGIWFAITPTLLPVGAATLNFHPINISTQLSSDTLPVADTTTLLEQGRRHYQAGRFAAAVTVWQQAAETYQIQDSPAAQALSLSYLASAYKELGQWDAAEAAIAQSLDLLQAPGNTTVPANRSRILAQAVNTQGSLQLARGNPEAALTSWQQAEAVYDELADTDGRVGSQINQAQALQSLGLYQQARTRLNAINEQLQLQPDSVLKAQVLQSLGVTLQRVGAFAESLQVLQQSLRLTRQLAGDSNTRNDVSAVWLNLGHTWQGLADTPQALAAYEQAATTATTAIAQVNAQLGQLSLLIKDEQIPAAQTLWSRIQAQLPNLTASRAAIYAHVNWVQSWVTLTHYGVLRDQGPVILQLLSSVVQQAQQLSDVRAESYVLGELGHVYEQTGQWAEAKDLTEKALALVQGLNASEIAYQWQWQLGRILCQGEIACTAEGDREGAIAAYTEAVTQLGVLRTDLVANSQAQFSFRQQVEPVYRELTTLLLTTHAPQAEVNQKRLKQARDMVESLQLAELDNFFQSACLDVQPRQIDQIDPTAAVLYPMVLPNRLAVILALKGQPLHYYETILPQAEIQDSLSQMRQSLSLAFPNQLRLQVSQQLYDWLIRPAEAYFTDANIQTLVFVPDGLLRSIPIAALHDGEQYLIEKYSTAVNSGLRVLEAEPLIPEQFQLLLGGLTESRLGFAALSAASFEVEQIAAQIPAQIFLNQDFTQTNLQTQLGQSTSSIVHLITHGQFSSSQNDTFILAWDQKITAIDLGSLLQLRQLRRDNPIDLLVLSACQTASGDERAGLGLAGLALRSGTRSTLASLWSVDDQSTADLMAKFYGGLTQPGMTKAASLRQAQLELMQREEYQHPFFWAAFIMVGNWL